MSDKLNEFEKKRQEQKKVTEELQDEVSSLNEKLNGIRNRWIGKSNIIDEIVF